MVYNFVEDLRSSYSSSSFSSKSNNDDSVIDDEKGTYDFNKMGPSISKCNYKRSKSQKTQLKRTLCYNTKSFSSYS